jgi:serine protease Do
MAQGQLTPPAPDAAELANAPEPLAAAEKPATTAPAAKSGEASAPALPARTRTGVVVLERAGKPIALGTVLAGDGRILSALSPLAHGNDISARFADGSLSKVKLGLSDRAWDLALLVPAQRRGKAGLRASRESPTALGQELSAFALGPKNQLAPTRIDVKGARSLVGGDAARLNGALELGGTIEPTSLGTPIVDHKGDVVAIVARACAPVASRTCTPAPYGAPMQAIKSFLRKVPSSNKSSSGPSLGIDGVAGEAGPVQGVRVRSVAPRSPAARAGIRGGGAQADLIVAVDGSPITTPEALAAAIAWRAPGTGVDLLVFRAGKYRTVSAQLEGRADDATQGGRPMLRKPPNARPARGPRPPDPRMPGR